MVHQTFDADSDDELDGSGDPMEDSGCTKTAESSDEEEDVDDAVLEDMIKIESSFHGFSARFRLIDRIGEGTQDTKCRSGNPS